ncbi:uncharacterized protein LOC111594144 [Drosophila hydei]|uniref:Uncharacterized protein LOC111594144 n=1 Tax=Drosophila hydei TaxID=7224 RepID=A0A6J1LIC7_DROHY|nr:uncharacterized protein LOC111594144 [Drosophila hydei]
MQIQCKYLLENKNKVHFEKIPNKENPASTYILYTYIYMYVDDANHMASPPADVVDIGSKADSAGDMVSLVLSLLWFRAARQLPWWSCKSSAIRRGGQSCHAHNHNDYHRYRCYHKQNQVGLKSKGPDDANEAHLCDDNPLVMQLARLYVISPERIVLLLAEPMLVESCEEISDVLDRINSATSNCIVAADNIYGKLAEGLSYYKSEVCDGADRKRQASLNGAHSCLKELRTDMIECEGPADWYEKPNVDKVCKAFNDVLDCYYTRSALLCGLDAAWQLRSFAGDSMKRAMINNCEVNKRLPRVPDAMPVFGLSSSNSFNILSFNGKTLTPEIIYQLLRLQLEALLMPT